MNLRNKKGTAIAIAILFLLILAYGYRCGFQKVCGSAVVEKTVRSGEEVVLPKGAVSVEVVDTLQSRAQGLSGRSGLGEGEGMLFVFDHPGKYGFWMKDMLFSIDIIWIAEDGTVVHVERDVSPDTYEQIPPKTFMNTPDAKYVLELASGQSERYGLYLGSKVKIGE